MIEIEGLHVHYGRSHVLQGVTLNASIGETVGLFGRNGAGKSTLFKTIVGWLSPSLGDIRLFGEALTGSAPEEIAARGLGFVPEDRRIFPGLSVQENLELGLRLRKRRSDRKIVLSEIYDRFHVLSQRRFQMGTTLSGGEQQLLAIARALVGAPRVLLLDEPSEGLAPTAADVVFEIIASLKKEGMTILLIDQNLDRAMQICDRFYVLDRGLVALEGDKNSANATDRIAAAMA